MLKTPLPYFGGKMAMAGHIASLLPAHHHYVELFGGSLAVLFAKKPSPRETANDLDSQVMNFWRVLRDQPERLVRACALTPHSLGEYEAAALLDDPAADEVERARRLWTRLAQSRSARPMATGWRFQIGDHGATRGPEELMRYVLRMPPAWARLRDVSLDNRPALDLIALYGRDPGVLFYADPPYLGSTRNSGSSYRHEMLAGDEHCLLAEALHGVAGPVVLSGYPSPLYDEHLYADWHRYTWATHTAQGGAAIERTEVLWSNVALNDALQPQLFDE